MIAVKDPKLSADRLVVEALMRGSGDNVTAIVAFLRPVATLERIFGEGITTRHITPTHFGTGQAARPSHALGAKEMSNS